MQKLICLLSNIIVKYLNVNAFRPDGVFYEIEKLRNSCVNAWKFRPTGSTYYEIEFNN